MRAVCALAVSIEKFAVYNFTKLLKEFVPAYNKKHRVLYYTSELGFTSKFHGKLLNEEIAFRYTLIVKHHWLDCT